ncbi:MAG TPA: hypothetical protein VMP01_26920 [Pirellulaceae bacterium]|nr:hypothetical protein [Pirellulaceae bacterium]
MDFLHGGSRMDQSRKHVLVRDVEPATRKAILMLAELTQAASWLTFLIVWAMAGRILTYR